MFTAFRQTMIQVSGTSPQANNVIRARRATTGGTALVSILYMIGITWLHRTADSSRRAFYGCYCGMGNVAGPPRPMPIPGQLPPPFAPGGLSIGGPNPFDKMDACCETHDDCYSNCMPTPCKFGDGRAETAKCDAAFCYCLASQACTEYPRNSMEYQQCNTFYLTALTLFGWQDSCLFFP